MWGWLLLAALALAAAACASNYAEFFAREPLRVAAGMLVCLVFYAPGLWLARHLDRRAPAGWRLYLFVFLFTILLTPITSEVTHGLIERMGWRYFYVVGPTEETTKLLPLVVLLAFGYQLSWRNCIVLGIVAGLGFATVEYAVGFALDNFPTNGWRDLIISFPARWTFGLQLHAVWAALTCGAIGYARERSWRPAALLLSAFVILFAMANHGLQDFIGKVIGPMAMAVLEPLLTDGTITEAQFQPGAPLFIAAMIYGATVNLLIITIPLWPFLWWMWRGSRRSAIDADAPDRPGDSSVI